MATYELTIPDLVRTRGSGRARYTLDGSVYAFTFQFNEREGRWTVDVADVDEDPIVSGLALVPLWGLLELVTDARRPPGELMLVGAPGDVSPPGLADLGVSKRLLYYEAT
jgi:hypothetical protein